jgi:hypothetical protein
LYKSISFQKASVITGIALLLMVFLAPFAFFYVFQNIIDPIDAAVTMQNITASQTLFRIGVMSLLIVVVLDIIVAWGFYILLAPVNKMLSMLAAWMRIIYASIFAIAISRYFTLVQLVKLADVGVDIQVLHGQIHLLVLGFADKWNLGLAIFGLHLVLVGILIFRSEYIPKVLGILLIIAGLGYMIDSAGKILMAYFDFNLALYTFIGEVVIIFWLLLKGRKMNVID